MFNKSIKSFESSAKGNQSVATIFEAISSGTAKTYTEDGTGDGYPPRALVPQAAGNVVVTGWDDTSVTFAATAGQVIPIMPKTISASTAVNLVALW